MRGLLLPAFLLFAVCFMQCQDNPPTQKIVNANQLNVLLPSPPTPPQFVSASVVGNSGPQSYFYWVIARNTVANSGVSIPAQASFVVNTLSSSSYVKVSWNAAQGATGYDVLRTNDTTPPQGACNCAVATNVSGLTTNDQSNSLNSYTVTNLNPSTLGLSLQNIVISAGVSHLELFQGTVPNGPFTFVADLSLAGGGGVTFPLHGPNGTCAAPTYSFTNSTNTGITLNAVGDLATCAAGTRITDTTASGLTLNAGQLLVPNGSAGAPSITTSHGNGIYFTGTGTLASDAVNIVAGLGSDNFQVQGFRIRTFVPLSATSGSAASPAYTFQSTISGTGMYYSFSGVVDQLNFSAGGSNYQTCQSGGFLNGQCSLVGNLIINPSAPFVNTSNAIPLDITATWNNGATTFAGLIRANVTNTASAAGSLLMDLQVGGVSQASIDEAGNLIVTSCTGCGGGGSFPLLAPDGTPVPYTFASDGTVGMFLSATGELTLTAGGGNLITINASGLNLNANQILVPDGSSILSSYSFSNDSSTGMSLEGPGTLSINALGSQAIAINGTNEINVKLPIQMVGSISQIFAIDGTNTTPGWAFTSEGNTGMYLSAPGTITVTILGVDVGTFTSTGANFPVTSTVTVPHGGTGSTTLTAHGVLIGNTVSAINVTSAGSAGQVLTSNGASADPTFQSKSVATADLTGQTAAITATTIYAVPAAAGGMYRVCYAATVTTAASVSSVLGGTNGFQVVYTDLDTSVVKNMPGSIVAGFNSNATNSTANGTISACFMGYAKASTNIQYKFDYTSVNAGEMVYNLHIKVEQM